MSIYTFTDELLKASTVQMMLDSMVSQSPKSAFNSMSFTSGPVTDIWRLTLTIAPTEEDEWRALRALTFRLRRGKNQLRVYDPSSTTLRGAGGASPTINVRVNGAAGDETISLNNLTVSQSIALADGDYIGIGENLHMVMGDVGSDGSGYCTANILPALRQGVAVDDPVNTLKPTGLFIPLSVPIIPVVAGQIGQSFTIDFMEDPDLG